MTTIRPSPGIPAFLAACLLAAAPARGAEPAPPFQPVGQAVYGSGDKWDQSAIATGDFNADGAVDFAATLCAEDYYNPDDTDLVIHLGNGDGTFREQVPHHDAVCEGRARGLCVTDADGDGNADLVFVSGAYQAPGLLHLRYGNGLGAFSESEAFPLPEGLDADAAHLNRIVAAGDFDLDGDNDLAVVSHSEAMYVLLNTGQRGAGNFSPAVTYAYPDSPDPFNGAGGGNGMAMGLFNNDAIPDLAIVDSSDDYYLIYIGNGDGTFQDPTATPGRLVSLDGPDRQPYDVLSVSAADVDRDGKADLVISAWDPAWILCVCFGHGDGTFSDPNDPVEPKPTRFFSSASLFGTSLRGRNVLQTGDFNDDGCIDVAMACSARGYGEETGGLFILPGNGTSGAACFKGVTAGGVCVEASGRCADLAVADAEGDGRPDVLFIRCDGLGEHPRTVEARNRFWQDAPQIWMEPAPTLEDLPYTEVTFVIVDAQGWGNLDFNTLVVDVNGGRHWGLWVKNNAAWSVTAGGRVVRGRIAGPIPPNANRFDLAISDLSEPPHTGSETFVYD